MEKALFAILFAPALMASLVVSASAQPSLPSNRGTPTVATTNSVLSNAKKRYIVTMKRSPKGKFDVEPEFDRGVVPEKLAQEFGLAPSHNYHHALKGFAAEMDDQTAGKLRDEPRVLAVEADGPVTLCGQTVPTGVLRMGLTNFPVAHLNATSYRDPVMGASQPIDVDVAVFDTGIDLQHPDLNVVQAQDFTGEGTGGQDMQGHGTHVSGIIGAINNTFGVVGVAPGVRLWSVQVLDGSGHGAWESFLAGMDYLAQNADKISLANASMGGTGAPYVAIRTAVQNVVNLGVVFVAAAGNNSTDVAGTDGVFGINPATGMCDDFLPAAAPETMAVSAMNVHTDSANLFSNYGYAPRDINYVVSPGGTIDVAAPGSDTGDSCGCACTYGANGGILSTWVGQTYCTAYGTSMASPHAAGLVALYIAANGRATNAAGVYAIRQAIVNSALPQSQWNNPNPNPVKNGVVPLPAPLAIPSENWVPRPNITTAGATPQGFQVNFKTVPGYTYTVQYSASLGQGSQWTSLVATNGNGRVATVSVTDSTPDAERFYRVARQPAP